MLQQEVDERIQEQEVETQMQDVNERVRQQEAEVDEQEQMIEVDE